MRAALAAVLAAVVIFFGYHYAAAHHIGAPPLPYGPCPKHTTLIYVWYPGNRYPHGASGTEYWLGQTEVATCGSGVTIGVGAR